MSYNIEIDVKYKIIEEELLEKIEKNTKDNLKLESGLGYTEQEVLEICEELYKHELLLVFQVKNITDKKVQHILSELWKKIQNYPDFLKIIEKYKDTMSQMDMEQSFILMFNYSLFSIIHKCIVCIYKDLPLEKELLYLEEKINQ